MLPNAISPLLRQAWYRWKGLKLPWRKRFFVGLDLSGNTFWEFRDTLSSHKHRMRRIVQYRHATHLSDVTISPQWHSWLRHTRSEPPSLDEQSQDLVRQEQLKVLAAQADARWATKESLLEPPGVENTQTSPKMAFRSPRSALTAPTRSHRGGGLPTDQKRRAPATLAHTKAAHVLGVKEDVSKTIDFNSENNSIQAAAAEEEKADPWSQARGASGEEWQPKSWEGTIVTPR